MKKNPPSHITKGRTWYVLPTLPLLLENCVTQVIGKENERGNLTGSNIEKDCWINMQVYACMDFIVKCFYLPK